MLFFCANNFIFLRICDIIIIIISTLKGGSDLNKILYRFVPTLLALFMLFAVLPLTAIATVEGVVEELRSPFYNVSCDYEKQTSKIKLELRMKSEDVKRYSGYEIKLYALTASQSVEDIPKLLPVVSGIKPSNRTGAEVKGVDLSDRLSYYVFAMQTDEGLVCSDPILPEMDSVGASLSFKGINSASPTNVFDSAAGTVVVDVDIDRLIGNGSGYLYPTSDYTYTFSSTYLDSIDKLVKLYKSDSRKTLIRLYSSSDESNILSEDYADQRSVYAYVGFLFSRYSPEAYGGIGGIILGGASATVEKNAKSYANSLYAAAAGLADVGGSCPLIVPIGDDADQSFAFLDAICSMTEQLGGIKFTVMVESERTPRGFNDEHFASLDENAPTLEPTEGVISPDDISGLTSRIEKEYRSSVYPNVIYNWKPDGSVSGDAASVAYAYSYYRLFVSERVSCFIVNADDGFDSVIPTVKYINTERRDKDVDGLVAQVFGEEIFERLDSSRLSELRISENKIEFGAMPRFVGTVDYFDFSSSSGLSGWLAGEYCSSVFSNSGSIGRSLNANLSFAGDSSNGSAFIVYNYKYPESFLYTDFIAIELCVDSEAVNNAYRVTITLGGKDFLCEYFTGTMISGNTRTLYLDVRELDSSDTVNYLKISVDQTSGSKNDAQLKIYSVTANSLQYDNSTLKAHIKAERERIMHDGDTDDKGIDVNAVLFLAVPVVLTGFVMIGVSRRRASDAESNINEK